MDAADNDVDFRQFTRVLIVAPVSGCGYAGMAWVGKVTRTTNDGTVSIGLAQVTDYADPLSAHYVYAHELGHTFGVHHAGFRNCGSVSICTTNTEYGNRYSPLSNYRYSGHLDAIMKNYIGWWYAPTNVQTVTSSGTFTLEPLETATPGLKALLIPRGATSDVLSVEFRQPIGIDTKINTGTNKDSTVFQGALIHHKVDNLPHKTSLIDVTPPTESLRAALLPGETFVDTQYGISITVNSVSPSALNVTVNRGVVSTPVPTQTIPTATPTQIPTPTPTLPVGSNLLLNSSFETNNNGTPANWSGGAYDTSTAHTGVASNRIDGGGDRYAYQQPSLKPSTTYTLQGWIKTQNVPTTDFGVRLRYAVTGGTSGVYGTSLVKGTSDWTFVTTTFSTPSDYTNGRLDLHAATTTTSALAWFDDVSLCEGSCGTVVNPTSTPVPTIIVATPTPTRTPTPTSIPNGDTTRPTVSITNPQNGAVVIRRGTVNITASATDNVGVDRVTFSVGGNTSTDYSAPYSYSWSVSAKPNQSYTVTATAYDDANNSASHSINVTSNK